MPSIVYRGTSVPLVSLDKLTPGEMAAVERVTGFTHARISRMQSTCVCDHADVAFHLHRGDDGEVLDDTACMADGCGCPEFDADVPVVVQTAFTWVALRRAMPALKFGDVQDTPGDEFGFEDDPEPVESPDPTQPAEDAAPPVASTT